MKTFSEVVTSPVLRANLAKQGFNEPTPVQAAAIPPALAGQDVVATAQTGTGKTLAFCLPIIERLSKTPADSKKPQALILSPTRELALQIQQVFASVAHGAGIRSAVVVGGMSEHQQLQAIKKGPQVLIATPGRLCDFLDRKLVSLDSVRIVVLDEADRMLDMGFLPSVESILRKTAPGRQTLFFSATFEATAERLVGRYMKDPVRLSMGPVAKLLPQVELHLYEVEQDRKFSLLVSLLQAKQGSFLVFARTKRGAERLAKKLGSITPAESGGIRLTSTAIHGDRSQSQRNRALSGFQDGEFRVLVATDVAARGIHVDGIAHVVNFDLPGTPDDFIHRVGRTGRAGATGVASTFATSADRGELRNIERTVQAKLIRKETPAGLPREDRHSAGAGYDSDHRRAPVVPITKHVRSFRSTSRRYASAR